MASSTYSSTEETTNANRACRLLLGPCTDELRDVLRHCVPPPTFTHVLRQHIINLPRLSVAQRTLIFPIHGYYTGNYNDMDITLLYTLLQNICSIPPHSKGWGNDPDPYDVSVSASIERIRIGRNDCVHSPSPSLSNTDFNRIWSSVRSAIVVLDSFLGNNNRYENEVDFLRQETMDPINDRNNREELLRQTAEDQTTRDMVVNLENDMSELKKTAIPENVRVILDNKIKRWRENDKLYVETRSFSSMMEKVREESYITFVGVPGSGKSGTACHIALKLHEEEDYQIVPVTELRDMVQYCDPHNAQVFIIDDVIGVLGVQNEKLNLLVDYKEKIENPMMKKSKTLMTCRKTVYNEVVSRTCVSFLRKENNVIDLQHSDHLLSNEDKKNLFQKYGLNIFTEILTYEWLKNTSQMFPLLCRLYSKGDTFRKNGVDFFFFPFRCILEELDKMQSENKLHYATLILCMFNNKILSRDIFKKNDVIFSEIKRNVLENCEVESCTDTFKFFKALAALDGTYTCTIRNGDEFTFFHDRLYELTACHYGKKFPNEIVKFMSSDFIANFVKTIQQTQVRESHEHASGVSNEDLSIILPCELYPMLAERLYRDVEVMKLYDVFMNGHLNHPDVCKAFIEVLREKPYEEINALFLSIQQDVSEIFRKGRSMIKERINDEK
ncbi:uncharacterized protein LOC134230502 [Saccostrea cucullata]|uniref:uncharacterized protein LOC134230502 n=1 Tax=Saccostrea cuccullata TaxID=36930 RepID=UPI002ED4AACA